MSDTKPLFDLSDKFTTTVTIGAVALPIYVRRFTRTEMEAFEKKWAALIVTRGEAPAPEGEAADRIDRQRLEFFEESIKDAITLDAGYVRDRGHDVVDGTGLIGVFHARKDALVALLTAVYTENKLVGIFRKNLNSPRDSAGGSTASVPTSGEPRLGGEPGSTATRADGSGTAAGVDATGANASDGGDDPSSSGPTRSVH